MLGLFISANTGVSTMITQITIVFGYIVSTVRYEESINYICLLGAAVLIGSIYATIFDK